MYPLIIDVCVRVSGARREGDDVLGEGYHAMPGHHRRSRQRQRLRLHRLRPDRPFRAHLRDIRLQPVSHSGAVRDIAAIGIKLQQEWQSLVLVPAKIKKLRIGVLQLSGCLLKSCLPQKKKSPENFLIFQVYLCSKFQIQRIF